MPNHVRNRLILKGDQSQINEIAERYKLDDDIVGSLDFNKIIPMPKELDITSGSDETTCIPLYLKAVCPITPPIDNLDIEKFDTETYKAVLERLQVNDFFNNYEISKIMERNLDIDNIQDLLDKGRKYVDNVRKYGYTTWYDWRIANWGSKWNAYHCEPFANNTFVWETAWSNVTPIIEKLSAMYPDITFEYAWADEDFGSNVGKEIIRCGKIEDMDIPSGGTKEAFEMAAEIREESCAEYGYYYDETTDTYVYRDED